MNPIKSRSQSEPTFTPVLKSLAVAMAVSSLTLVASGCSSHAVEPGSATPSNYQAPDMAADAHPAPMQAQRDVTDNMDTAEVDYHEPSASSPELASENMEQVSEAIDSADTVAAHPEATLFRFGFDKQQLDEENTATLAGHGQFLAQHPQQRITINGHADQQGDPVYNEQLSLKRAQYVAQVLIDNGATEEQIEIFSFGSTDPVQDAVHPRQNRRVELIYAEDSHYAADTESSDTTDAGNTLSAVGSDLEDQKASAADVF